MRKTWMMAGVAVAWLAATGGVVATVGEKTATTTAQASPANTVAVERGSLSATVSQYGTLTYQARSDGSPYIVINQARGSYTTLPQPGHKVSCGGVLYRVDDRPVLLLCGQLPAYRGLHRGDTGQDVRQLNRNLHLLGYDTDAGVHIAPGGDDFSPQTEKALKTLQRDRGLPATGALATGDAVVQPGPLRIGKVPAVLGGRARPGARVLAATSDTLQVQVDLGPAEQRQVKKGDRVQITLPDNTTVTGNVDGLGRFATTTASQDGAGSATIPAHISLDDPRLARGLDRAPVHVDITTAGVKSALSVPVTALVGKSGGGFAVEVVHGDGRRALVTVRVGLFDGAHGRVQVEGDLHEGDLVVVPSS
jgi:peptidoglycan hydrolase-like protein with peptidoglycan-binding domain